MRISVIGLGKLGLCTAACFAAKGHEVIGVDNNPAVLSALRDRRSPISETGLPDLLAKAWQRFMATDDYTAAVRDTEITLVIVPTPSLCDGRFSNDYINAVLNHLVPGLKAKNDFHIVDIVSTVMPGSCEGIFRPFLESATRKICGRDFGLVYNPEFIALGSVTHDFLNPDLVLIGESDPVSGAKMEKVYHETLDNQPTIARMTLTSAEVAKLALNCYVTMKISFANELASVCERLAGVDIDAVISAIGADSRIGNKCLRPGLGFGGPCFPRDNSAFQAFAKELGAIVHLGPAVIAVNRAVVDRLYMLTTHRVKPGATIAIFGLAYKPHTHISEESQAIQLALRLAEDGYRVSVHDPQALGGARQALGERVRYCSNLYDAAKGAAAIAVLTPWPEYGAIDWRRVAEAAEEHAVVIDAWRICAAAEDAGLGRRMLGRIVKT